MKYSEFHRIIARNGWKYQRSSGSHHFYEKDGILSPPVPYHGSKEMPEGLRKRIVKDMRLK